MCYKTHSKAASPTRCVFPSPLSLGSEEGTRTAGSAAAPAAPSEGIPVGLECLGGADEGCSHKLWLGAMRKVLH